jgi:DNA-binding response OmpR family regulator
MATRTRVLVVDSDLDLLSRIYLALLHRNYKAEATDKSDEIAERMKRLKPSVIILGFKEYKLLKPLLKVPAILLTEEPESTLALPDDVIAIQKPFQIDTLIRTIESLVI